MSWKKLLPANQFLFSGKYLGRNRKPVGVLQKVFVQILEKEKIQATQLLSLGDGPVEISETRHLGGFTTGVASNEESNGSGIPDQGKRMRLIEAGAHWIIPDFRDAPKLADLILTK